LHGNKETQNSHNLSSEAVFDISINLEPFKKSGVKSLQVKSQEEG